MRMKTMSRRLTAFLLSVFMLLTCMPMGVLAEGEITDTVTVEGDQSRDLLAMAPYFWKTPHVGALRLAAKQSLTTEIGFRFLAYRRV